MQGTSAKPWTLTGLAIALLGIPAAVTIARQLGGDAASSGVVVARELAIFLFAGILVWIIRRQEGQTLASIGLRLDRPWRSAVRGLLLTIACFAVVIATLAAFAAFGVRYGEGPAIARAWPLTLLTVVRAGVVEEIFYRGFAIERLESMAGSKWMAAVLPLLAFTAFHYRQGAAGIVLALLLGAVLTLFYLWKRDLLAAIVAHFLVDFIPNLALPALTD